MSSGDRDERGYRAHPGQGPVVRTDVVDVYVFRRPQGLIESLEILQLWRSKEPLKDTWQPIMGHIEPGESAVHAALREAREEAGLSTTDPHLLGVWALEQVHPFYIAALDCIVMSPRFVAEVDEQFEPHLNFEHARWRWVPMYQAYRHFMWPGQRGALRELLELLTLPNGARDALRVQV